jgi:uncharacterized membrane protein
MRRPEFSFLKLITMNAAQIHLALNHAPLFLALTGGIILLYSLFTKQEATRRIALYLLVAGALLTLPVYFTGEGTEELVEELPGVSEGIIEQHEDMAKISLVIILITGVAALVSLFVQRNKSIGRAVIIVTAVLSLASFGVMAQTAHLGGQIRHSEIRSSNTAGGKEGEQENNKESDGEEKEEKEGKNTINDSLKINSAVADSLSNKPEEEKKDKDDD